MIGRDMWTWNDVELQRVVDATEWAHWNGASSIVAYAVLWQRCMQGVRAGGDRKRAILTDEAFRWPVRFYRGADGLTSRFASIEPFCIGLASRYDAMCNQFGRDRIVRLIQERARNILAARTLERLALDSAVPQLQETA